MFSRTKLLIVYVAVLSLAGLAGAQEPTARIVEYGRYKRVGLALIEAKDTSGGVQIESRAFQHLETTKKIPGQIGENFGFRVEFANLPKGVEYTIRHETLHPPIKQPDGKVLEKSVSSRTVKPGQAPGTHFGWGFIKGFEYELVPGNWTQVVYVNGKELTRMTFEIEAVKKAP